MTNFKFHPFDMLRIKISNKNQKKQLSIGNCLSRVFPREKLLALSEAEGEIGNSSLGFTLAELLTVAGILIVMSTIIAGMVVYTLRGSAKTRITTSVAQNGNSALSVMTRLITNSDTFVGIKSSGLAPTDPAAIYQDSCIPVGATPVPVVGDAIKVRGFDGGETIISCKSIANTNDIASISASFIPPRIVSLIDKSEVEVVPSSCSFTCTQTDEFSAPIINIKFGLKELSGSNPANFTERKAATTFQTSISVRNYR